MTVDPAVLLAGPRGRRLCLEWAQVAERSDDTGDDTADDNRLNSAIFYAAHNLDPDRGSSRVLFSFVAGQSAPPIAERPTPSAQEVAHLLAAAALADPDDRALLRALVAAVDHARYWQPPDGEDVLAAAPEMRAALARVAALIASSRPAAWWATPLDRAEQWAVEFEGTVEPGDPVQTAAQLLEQWGVARAEENALAERTWPADPRAVFSGPWWSKPPARLTNSTRALAGAQPVGLGLVEDALGWQTATAHRIHAPQGARVYEIDGADAWAYLCRRYPVEVTAARRQVWFMTTARIGRWVVPDWSRVALDFDAVHLTVAGYLATAGRAIPVADDLATVLAGWDPDQTWWFIDVEHDHSTSRVWRREHSDWAAQPDA